MKTLSKRYADISQRGGFDDLVQIWKSNPAFPQASDGPTVPYQQNTWVHTCVNAIARNVAQVPIKFKSKNGTIISEDNDTVKAFKNPNPLMTGTELLRATEIYLNTTGNALWVPVFAENGELLEIYVFGKHQLEYKIISGKVQWKVKWSDKSEIFSQEEVLHFRYFSPYDPVWGISPLAACRSAMLQDWWANKYNEAFFQNFADPGVVLTMPGNPAEPKRRELRESWEARHQGFGQSRRTALLWGGIEVKELQQANRRDMQFVEQKKMNREEILAVFRVPPVEAMLVEFASSRVESQRAQRVLFGEEVIWPELRYIRDKLNRFFDYWDLPYDVDWDVSGIPILQDSFATKLEQTKTLLAMGVPAADVIDILELPFTKRPWMKETWLPSNMAPASYLLEHPAGNNQSDNPAQPPPPKNPPKKPEKGPPAKQLLLTAPKLSLLEGKLSRLFFMMRNASLGGNFKEEFWLVQVNKLLEQFEIRDKAPVIMEVLKQEALKIQKEFPKEVGEWKVKRLFLCMKKQCKELAEVLCEVPLDN